MFACLIRLPLRLWLAAWMPAFRWPPSGSVCPRPSDWLTRNMLEYKHRYTCCGRPYSPSTHFCRDSGIIRFKRGFRMMSGEGQNERDPSVLRRPSRLHDERLYSKRRTHARQPQPPRIHTIPRDTIIMALPVTRSAPPPSISDDRTGTTRQDVCGIQRPMPCFTHPPDRPSTVTTSAVRLAGLQG